MSTEVSEASVEEVNGALQRNFASFGSQQWVDTATALMKAGGHQAAAQLAPGETVEWVTPGIVHRHGKVWPGAILLVTPHRLVVSASRGSIRTKREVSSLYRGPESLLSLSHRLLPGTSADHWTLEIATQQGPFLFAIPHGTAAEAVAHLTADFITGRARYTPQTGTVVNGVPWGATQHDQADSAAVSENGVENPFAAAKVDLAQATVAPPADPFAWPSTEGGPIEQPATQQFWSPGPEHVAAMPEVPEQRFWSPSETPSEAPSEAPSELSDLGDFPDSASLATEDWRDPTGDTSESTEALEPTSAPSERSASELDAAHPEADWYPDPLGEAELRYWDGHRWTHNTAN